MIGEKNSRRVDTAGKGCFFCLPFDEECIIL